MGLRSGVYSVYERRLRSTLAGLPVPRHVAIMIDGNRRWARVSAMRPPGDEKGQSTRVFGVVQDDRLCRCPAIRLHAVAERGI